MIEDGQRLAACRRFQKERMVLPRRIRKMRADLDRYVSDLEHYERSVQTFESQRSMLATGDAILSGAGRTPMGFAVARFAAEVSPIRYLRQVEASLAQSKRKRRQLRQDIRRLRSELARDEDFLRHSNDGWYDNSCEAVRARL